MHTTDTFRIAAYTRYTEEKGWKPCWAAIGAFLKYPLDYDREPSTPYEERMRTYAIQAAPIIKEHEDYMGLAIVTMLAGLLDCLGIATEHNETHYMHRYQALGVNAAKEVADMRAQATAEK